MLQFIVWREEFKFWYHVSHWHKVRMDKILAKKWGTSSNRKFLRMVKKFIYHGHKFNEIQVILETLKEKICNKYPDLRDGA